MSGEGSKKLTTVERARLQAEAAVARLRLAEVAERGKVRQRENRTKVLLGTMLLSRMDADPGLFERFAVEGMRFFAGRDRDFLESSLTERRQQLDAAEAAKRKAQTAPAQARPASPIASSQAPASRPQDPEPGRTYSPPNPVPRGS